MRTATSPSRVATATAQGLPDLFDARNTARAVGVAGAVALGVLASDDDGTVLCPYRRCTGGFCPLCGATRSFGRLLRADVAGAWARHPLVVLLALQVVVFSGLSLAARLRTDGSPSLLAGRWQLLLYANLALGAVLWVGRLATGEIPGPTTVSLSGLF